MVWFYVETKSISRTQTKFVKHFNLDRKHGTPSKPHYSGYGKQVFGDWVGAGCTSQWSKKDWEISTEHKVKRSTVHNSLCKDLKKFPYKIQIKQKIKAADKRARIVFCNWVSEQIEQKPLFLNNILFSDKAHFHLSGHVNKQNMRFWGSENPHEIVEKPLKVEKCTAWYAMSTHWIIGPYFFEEPETANAMTINQERYRHVLSKFWAALLRRVENRRSRQWFQQDGATPHTEKQTLEWIEERFHERVISLKTDNPWPPHSQGLSPPDFF